MGPYSYFSVGGSEGPTPESVKKRNMKDGVTLSVLSKRRPQLRLSRAKVIDRGITEMA